MEQIQRDALKDLIIKSAKGTKIIGLHYSTAPKLKKDCPFTNVKKMTSAVVMLGVDYSKRLAKNDETPAGAKPWYSLVDEQDWLVQHLTKGTYYLRVSPTGNNYPKSEYVSDQGTVTKEQLQDYFYASSGGVPEVYTVGFDAITGIAFAGNKYEVVDDPNAIKPVEVVF